LSQDSSNIQGQVAVELTILLPMPTSCSTTWLINRWTHSDVSSYWIKVYSPTEQTQNAKGLRSRNLSYSRPYSFILTLKGRQRSVKKYNTKQLAGHTRHSYRQSRHTGDNIDVGFFIIKPTDALISQIYFG